MNNQIIFKKETPLLMGIINLTPDSFSDGGLFNSAKLALSQAQKLEYEGADILDLGGESTGPNSRSVSLKEELKRVIPILKLIRKSTKLPISIDTYKSEVARQALEEGANLINDVTALRQDEKLAKVVAHYKCPIILMYSKDSTPRTTKKAINYKDVVATIKKFLQNRINFAKKQGILTKNIIIDPGMGAFISTNPKYSFEVISRLKELKTLKHPILIGVSRKSFLEAYERTRVQTNEARGSATAERSERQNKDAKSAALSAIAYLNGASIIRTHDIKTTKECLKWT